MDKYETAEKLNKLLGSFAGLKIEFLHHTSYKDECWEIFSIASEDIKTDELMDAIQESFDPEANKTELKLKLLEQLRDMWREWVYARQKSNT